MAITRKLLAHSDNETAQWLKVDHSSRYVDNKCEEWQFLFGPQSELSASNQIIKIAAELDTNTLDKIRLTGYLYNTVNGSIDAAATVIFNIYRVVDSTIPKWDDQLITTINGVLQSNNYFFQDILMSSLTGTNLDGDTTLMIEAVATRLGTTYRDRIYVNHLGVYDSILRLKQEVDFLAITKEDL